MPNTSTGMGVGTCHGILVGSYTKNSNKAKTVSAVKPMKKAKKNGKSKKKK